MTVTTHDVLRRRAALRRCAVPSQSTRVLPEPELPLEQRRDDRARLLDVDAHRHVLRQRERERDDRRRRRRRSARSRGADATRPVSVRSTIDVGGLRDAPSCPRLRRDGEPVAAVRRARRPTTRTCCCRPRPLLVEHGAERRAARVEHARRDERGAAEREADRRGAAACRRARGRDHGRRWRRGSSATAARAAAERTCRSRPWRRGLPAPRSSTCSAPFGPRRRLPRPVDERALAAADRDRPSRSRRRPSRVQASGDESRAWKRIGPPSDAGRSRRVQLRQPRRARSRFASAGSSAYARLPGHSLGPVSR